MKWEYLMGPHWKPPILWMAPEIRLLKIHIASKLLIREQKNLGKEKNIYGRYENSQRGGLPVWHSQGNSDNDVASLSWFPCVVCVCVHDFLFLSSSSSALFLTKNEFPKQYLSIFDKLKDVYDNTHFGLVQYHLTFYVESLTSIPSYGIVTILNLKA